MPCSDSSATPSSPSQLGWMIGLPWPNIRGSLKSPCNSRIPPQLEKNHVAPPSSQDEALGRYSVALAALVPADDAAFVALISEFLALVSDIEAEAAEFCASICELAASAALDEAVLALVCAFEA